MLVTDTFMFCGWDLPVIGNSVIECLCVNNFGCFFFDFFYILVGLSVVDFYCSLVRVL